MPTITLTGLDNVRTSVQGVMQVVHQGETVALTPAEWNALTTGQKAKWNVVDGSDIGLAPSSAGGVIELFSAHDSTLVQSASSTVGVDIPALNTTLTVDGSRPLHVEFGGWLRHTVVGGIPELQLVVDGAAVPGEACAATVTRVNDGYSVSRKARLSLTAGQHTIKIQLLSGTNNASAQAKGDAGITSWMIVTTA